MMVHLINRSFVMRMTLLLVLTIHVSACSKNHDGSVEGARSGQEAESAQRDQNAPLVVFAAASTAGPVQELADAFATAHGVEVRCSFASSSVLAVQAEEGALFDLFLSAHPMWMDELAKDELINPASRVQVLANRLVIVRPKDGGWQPGSIEWIASPLGAAQLPERIATGDPSHVPLGKYAKQALERLAWWQAVEPRVLTAIDARAALRLVELGEADAGIVYANDAMASERVEIVAELSEHLHAPIRYDAAISADAGARARELLTFLRSERARDLFTQSGFVVVGSPAE